MRRREFISVLGGAVVACSRATIAQQVEQTRRIAVLMNTAWDDREALDGLAAFEQGLQQFGWVVGRNVQLDIRWGENDEDLVRKYATELVALNPDIILVSGSPGVAAMRRVTRTIPIVFVRVADPVGGGFVDSLARPGGNTTGFMLFEYSFSAKWLELLKEIVPHLARAAVLRDATSRAGIGEFAAIQSAAPSLRVELQPVDTSQAGEVERALAALARVANCGVVVTPSAGVSIYRSAIIKLSAQYKLPAVYGFRLNAVDGGLIAYGPNRVDQFRRAGEYTDRILKGEKPADLPVQAPAKYELVVNLKTAKALDLTIPPALLARADEVIE